MIKFGLLIPLLCLAIFIEEAQSCWYNPGQGPSGKKKRDVSDEDFVQNEFPMDMNEKAVEMEKPLARANKFQSRK